MMAFSRSEFAATCTLIPFTVSMLTTYIAQIKIPRSPFSIGAPMPALIAFLVLFNFFTVATSWSSEASESHIDDANCPMPPMCGYQMPRSPTK